MMTNRPHGVLYVGVTSDLPRCVYEHREGLVPGFTSQYGLIRLVYHETFDMVTDAIQREKTIKHWPRVERQSDRHDESRMARPLQ